MRHIIVGVCFLSFPFLFGHGVNGGCVPSQRVFSISHEGPFISVTSVIRFGSWGLGIGGTEGMAIV